MTLGKSNGRSLREQLAAVVRNMLDLSIGTARGAVKRAGEIWAPAVEIERVVACERCHRDAAGDFLIWREHVWCVDCYDRARGGTVVRPEPLAEIRANELGLLN